MISYSLSKEYVDGFTIDAQKIFEEEKISSDKHMQYIQAYIKMLNQKLTLIYNLPLDTLFPQKFSTGCQPIMKEFFLETSFHSDHLRYQKLEFRLAETVLMKDVNEFIQDMHKDLLEPEIIQPTTATLLSNSMANAGVLTKLPTPTESPEPQVAFGLKL